MWVDMSKLNLGLEGESKKGGGGIEKNDNTFVQPAHKVIFLLLQL